MRNSPPLVVGPEDAAVLRAWISAGPAAATARRAMIVLLAGDGLGPGAIAERVGCSKQTAITWRERFRADGLDGLRDAPRSGRPATVDEAAVIVRTLEQPPGGSRWSTRLLAAELGISNAAVGNVWRARGMGPGVAGLVRFGTEPVLDAALDGVVGVHLGPPGRVLALRVGASGQTRSEGVVPVRERPPVGAELLAARAGGPDEDEGGDALGEFLRRLAALPDEQAVLAEAAAAGRLRRWLAGRPRATLHVVPAGLSWCRLAPLVCTAAAATPRGAASVADLVEALGAGRATAGWTAGA
jgi:transposase